MKIKKKAQDSPRYVFVHDGVETVVEIAAWQLQPQQRFEQMRPAELRAEGNVARLAVESDDRLHIRYHFLSFFLRDSQLI